MEQVPNAESGKHELERIHGIGPQVRMVLINGGVETLADLAEATISEISAIFAPVSRKKVPAPLRTPQRIGEMIQEAADLQWQTYEEFAVYFEYGESADGPRWRALVLPQTGGDKPEPKTWQSHNGAYVVKFERQRTEDRSEVWQTLVEHTSTEESANITGWTPDKWWPWIVEKEALGQVVEATRAQNEDVAEKEKTETAPGSADATSSLANTADVEIALTITEFTIHPPADQRVNTLLADVTFEASDELLGQSPPASCQIEVLIAGLENGESLLVGHANVELQSEKRSYATEIAFEMPLPGRFQPHCVVLLLPSGELGGYKKAPVFGIASKTSETVRAGQQDAA